MTRYLFAMFEGGGNVPPQLGIVRRLLERGHDVRVLGDPCLEGAVRAAGVALTPFGTAPHHNMRSREADVIRDWAPRNPMRQLERVTGQLMFGPAAAYARDTLDAIEKHRPDVLALDYMLFGALVAAEKSGLPTAALMHTPYSMPTPGVPPFGLGFRPARGSLGRLRDGLLRRLMVRTFDKQGLPPLNAARAQLGLEPLASVFEQLSHADRVLVLTLASYDFASRVALPANVVYVGPQLDDPTWADGWSSPWPLDAEEPLVVVALGSTFQDQGELTQLVVDALGALPVRGLVTLGDVFETSSLRLPTNVVAVGSAPHRAVFPFASAVIAHGGHGTVMKALAHGVPVLCIPLGRDQADNAARVAATGAGLHVKRGASARAVRQALVRLLEEPGFAGAARRVAAEVERSVAADRVVVELEALGRESHVVAAVEKRVDGVTEVSLGSS